MEFILPRCYLSVYRVKSGNASNSNEKFQSTIDILDWYAACIFLVGLSMCKLNYTGNLHANQSKLEMILTLFESSFTKVSYANANFVN